MKQQTATANKQIAIITSCQEDWGGSEELWARAIPYLQSAGYNVTVLKHHLNKQHNQFVKLARQGVVLEELQPAARQSNKGVKSSMPAKAIAASIKLLRRIIRRIFTVGKRNNTTYFTNDNYLQKKLRTIQPQLVIISQGINFDGLGLAYNCAQLGLPYVLIAQKAVDFYWPYHAGRAAMRDIYLKAAWSYFVSNRNKKLTEEQFGICLPKSEVIYNPVKVSRQILPMPGTKQGFKLACIGRYFLLDKGQDILIRIMAQPKWKARPIVISFIGSGIDKEGLIEMAALLGLENIRFLDFVEDIEELWKNYHALILPARSEGLPLVLLEAMACGRTAIVSTAGGNGEVITDGVNGFIGYANENDFDMAMERAWEARAEWEVMGKRAYAFIEENIPVPPEKKFAESLLNRIGR
jgi:glycosyltransferase involved in cell wall biosynthesis